MDQSKDYLVQNSVPLNDQQGILGKFKAEKGRGEGIKGICKRDKKKYQGDYMMEALPIF